jgi:hypothetical protein
MAEVGLQLMHDPFWLRIGSLDETRRIFGAAIQIASDADPSLSPWSKQFRL